MVNIPTNFPKPNLKNKCFCGKLETMLHIYNCEVYNTKQKLHYDKIFNGNLNQQIEIFKQFEVNLEKREDLKNRNQCPCDPPVIRCDLIDCSNG